MSSFLLRSSDAADGVPVGTRPCFVGRAPGNDLVLQDPRVSGRHASLWSEGDACVLLDLGSRNGTTIDGVPVVGRVTVAPGQQIQLGHGPTLALSRRDGPLASSWQLRDRTSGVIVPIAADRFTFGRDVVVSGLPEADHLTLLVDPDGGLWRAEGDDLRPVHAGDPLQVGSSTWVAELADAPPGPTLQLERATYPYDVTLYDAAVVVASGGQRCWVEAPNRFALLTVLGRARQAALASDDLDGGWVDDETLSTGIWGAASRHRSPRVVLCRTRGDLRDAGLDPWCLEKRAHGTRLRVQRVRDAENDPA